MAISKYLKEWKIHLCQAVGVQMPAGRVIGMRYQFRAIKAACV